MLRILRRFGLLLPIGCLATLGCVNLHAEPGAGQQMMKITGDSQFLTADQKLYTMRQWEPPNGREPKLILLGIHGINGAADDWRVLGEYLQANDDEVTLYSYDLRGQGRDPNPQDRGDIEHANLWVQDLLNLSSLLKQRYPGVPLVWLGESLGSLIAMRAVDQTSAEALPCEALALCSPIAGFGDKVKPQRIAMMRAARLFMPAKRIAAESFAKDGNTKVASGEEHAERAELNEWHVKSHTLRSLVAIGNEISQMKRRAARLKLPCLVLYGGRDVFTATDEVEKFVSRIPQSVDKTVSFYPSAYHLLFHDDERKKVCADLLGWVQQFKKQG